MSNPIALLISKVIEKCIRSYTAVSFSNRGISYDNRTNFAMITTLKQGHA